MVIEIFGNQVQTALSLWDFVIIVWIVLIFNK